MARKFNSEDFGDDQPFERKPRENSRPARRSSDDRSRSSRQRHSSNDDDKPFRGKRNNPGYVEYTAKNAAEVLGMDFAELAEITAANTKRLFKKIK